MTFENLAWPDVAPLVTWTFGAAFLTLWLITALGSKTIRWYRNRRYLIGEGNDAEKLARRKAIMAEFGIVKVPETQTTIAAQLRAIKPIVDTAHENANRLQGRYHDRVARCVLALSMTVFVLALSLTLLQTSKIFKAYAAAIDVLGLSYAFWLWCSATIANGRWIVQRIKTELLRQWMFLGPLFQVSPELPTQDVGLHLSAIARRIDEQVLHPGHYAWWKRIALLMTPRKKHPGNTFSIEGRISAFWSTFHQECYRAGFRSNVTVEDALLYVGRRPIRQLDFFRVSGRRLHHAAKTREWSMAALYLFAVLLACTEAALEHKEDLLPWIGAAFDSLSSFSVDGLAMGLLTITVTSTAVTSLYLSRNDRSLLHRYSSQERRIEDWLGQFARSAGGGGAVSLQELPQPILEFEALMIEELVDWVHISSRDALELGA